MSHQFSPAHLYYAILAIVQYVIEAYTIISSIYPYFLVVRDTVAGLLNYSSFFLDWRVANDCNSINS